MIRARSWLWNKLPRRLALRGPCGPRRTCILTSFINDQKGIYCRLTFVSTYLHSYLCSWYCRLLIFIKCIKYSLKTRDCQSGINPRIIHDDFIEILWFKFRGWFFRRYNNQIRPTNIFHSFLCPKNPSFLNQQNWTRKNKFHLTLWASSLWPRILLAPALLPAFLIQFNGGFVSILRTHCVYVFMSDVRVTCL